MKIAIIGAGFSGLTCGYFLSQKGHKVVIFEKDNFSGGLSSGFKLGDWYLERFYHHIFKSDKAIQELTSKLGLKDIWLWKDCGAPIFFNGKTYPFSTPLDLLKFYPLSLLDRIRIGLCSLYLKSNFNYSKFSGLKAYDWLYKWMGKESVKIIWKPLLQKKFGKYYNQISMSFVWARINKRSRILGYPKGGFQIIANKLINEINKRKGKILLNKEISHINQLASFDKIIFTGASSLLIKIAPKLPKWYQNKLKKIEYYGVITVLLLLRKPLNNWVYWLNINDLKIPFVGCIQHANLVNKKSYGNLYPVYLVSYLPFESKLFKENDKNITNYWIKSLTKINKGFNRLWIKKFYVFKEFYAQPIFKINDNKHISDFQTPLKKLLLINMAQVYPWDRGINQAVELGNRITLNL